MSNQSDQTNNRKENYKDKRQDKPTNKMVSQSGNTRTLNITRDVKQLVRKLEGRRTAARDERRRKRLEEEQEVCETGCDKQKGYVHETLDGEIKSVVLLHFFFDQLSLLESSSSCLVTPPSRNATALPS